jgi:hypothetical protein
MTVPAIIRLGQQIHQQASRTAVELRRRPSIGNAVGTTTVAPVAATGSGGTAVMIVATRASDACIVLAWPICGT